MAINLPKEQDLVRQVFAIDNENTFREIALSVYRYQFEHNAIYQRYCLQLNKRPEKSTQVSEIPYLPISFFKSHDIKSGVFQPEIVFESSGTTGMIASRHQVRSVKLYEESFLRCFHHFYGSPEDYCFIGLLPSYLERGNSSLVYMVDCLIKASGHPLSGFYLHDFKGLSQKLEQLEHERQKTLLIGVTYALLDFAAAFPMTLQHTIVMETGGMKGRREELVRSEVHNRLKQAFSLPYIHSEYGMTELLSQAYAKEEGLFQTPAWMKFLIREEDDPMTFKNSGTGVINIIDLANLFSCSFIATEDIGRLYTDGTIEILGRIDHADIRGCSLLAI